MYIIFVLMVCMVNDVNIEMNGLVIKNEVW